MDIDDIIQAIETDQIRITDHAVDAAEDDELTLDEIFFSVFRGEIIESYPEECPPRCLVFGKTANANPVHSVWAYNSQNQWAVLITVYRPDPARWINWRIRRF
ncbi:DUF4258 domain-containing protein [Microcoleus sp. FACHB-1515]|uniref:DUF4258 domain-containing protein n=1 Tax=Cyanophyceae TaxID=3028117 RepID=UPI001681FAE6|nr:DUF4258 domain-containing protein [Microcoleus sp. FACHB-1515]MBD2092722.1 DUF4258 domain-containing protein [Microcoleus sp. FACHB-1515]